MKRWFNKVRGFLLLCCVCTCPHYLFSEIGNITQILQAKAHCPIILRADDFGSSGIIIDQPGYYKLCDNVEFASGSVTAISVQSPYVIIDMNTKAIYGAGLSIGIDIADSIHDVVIKGGTISEFSLYGIYVDENCYKVFLDSINLNDASCTSAIVFNGTSGNPVHECAISYCKINEIMADVVIDVDYCSDIEIIGSSFNKNVGSTNLRLVDVDSSEKCRFLKCHFNDNAADGLGELNCIEAATVSSFVFEHCTFNNNAMADGELRGIYLNGSNGSLIKECIFANNQSSSATQGSTGLCSAIDDLNGEGNKIVACIITNNATTTNLTSTDAEIYGIRVTGAYVQNCYIEQCYVTKNNATASGATSDATSYGIFFDAGLYHYLSDCTMLAHRAAATGTASGVGIYNNSLYSTMRQNTSSGNLTYGIYNALDTIIVSCRTGYNGTNYGGIASVLPNSTDVVKLGDNITKVERFENLNISVN